jgi:hypothetical protein
MVFLISKDVMMNGGSLSYKYESQTAIFSVPSVDSIMKSLITNPCGATQNCTEYSLAPSKVQTCFVALPTQYHDM